VRLHCVPTPPGASAFLLLLASFLDYPNVSELVYVFARLQRCVARPGPSSLLSSLDLRVLFFGFHGGSLPVLVVAVFSPPLIRALGKRLGRRPCPCMPPLAMACSFLDESCVSVSLLNPLLLGFRSGRIMVSSLHAFRPRDCASYIFARLFWTGRAVVLAFPLDSQWVGRTVLAPSFLIPVSLCIFLEATSACRNKSDAEVRAGPLTTWPS